MKGLPWHRLVIVVNPCGEVRVSICIDVLVDVGLSREARRFTTDVLLPRRLIHAYVIDLHVHRERYVFDVNETEVFGHSQINDDILERVFSDGYRAMSREWSIPSVLVRQAEQKSPPSDLPPHQLL